MLFVLDVLPKKLLYIFVFLESVPLPHQVESKFVSGSFFLLLIASLEVGKKPGIRERSRESCWMREPTLTLSTTKVALQQISLQTGSYNYNMHLLFDCPGEGDSNSQLGLHYLDVDPDPDPTSHFDADPDQNPGPGFQKKAQNLEKVCSNRLMFKHFGLFRIRIQPITLKRIRIWILSFNLSRIRSHNTVFSGLSTLMGT
jgi:hypothetical protein